MEYGYNAYSYDTGAVAAGTGIGVGMLIFYLVIAALMLVSMWKIFVKCGKPGWACLIPIYNIIVMLEIAEKPLWYIVLFCIPIANIYALWVCYDGMAKKLGKSTGFTVGMLFLPVIFFPILAFSKSSVAETNTISAAPETTFENVSEPVQAPVSEQVNNTVTPTNDFASSPVEQSEASPVADVNPTSSVDVAPSVDTTTAPSFDSNNDTINNVNDDINNSGQM